MLSSPIELVTRAVSVGSEIDQGGCAVGVKHRVKINSQSNVALLI